MREMYERAYGWVTYVCGWWWVRTEKVISKTFEPARNLNIKTNYRSKTSVLLKSRNGNYKGSYILPPNQVSILTWCYKSQDEKLNSCFDRNYSYNGMQPVICSYVRYCEFINMVIGRMLNSKFQDRVLIIIMQIVFPMKLIDKNMCFEWNELLD